MHNIGSPLVPPVMTTFSCWLADGPCEAAAWVLQCLSRCLLAVTLLYLHFCCCRARPVVCLASELCWICSILATAACSAMWHCSRRDRYVMSAVTQYCSKPRTEVEKAVTDTTSWTIHLAGVTDHTCQAGDSDGACTCCLPSELGTYNDLSYPSESYLQFAAVCMP